MTDRRRPWRVFVIDEHRIFREGLTALLRPDYRVCGESSSVAAAIKAIRVTSSKPDVIVSEISHSEHGTSVDLLKELRSQWPEVPVVVLSACDENLFAERALHAGAIGYVMKSGSIEELRLALGRALENKIYLDDQMSESLLSKHTAGVKHAGSPIEDLSDREFEIFQLVGHGMSTKEIAAELCISVKTVETHRSHIAAKLPLGPNDRLLCFAARWVGANA